jgi:broad specificity phosphatase PhoE
MGTLYLVRHGQASFGADDYDQLSPLGQQQTVRLGEYFIRAIHPAPLPRPDTPEAYRHHFRLLRDGLTQWMNGVVSPQGMPAYDTFVQGITSALEHVRKNHHGGHVLLVSSGGPISTAVGHVLGTSPETTIELNLRIRNSSVTEFAFTPKRHMLVTYNTLPHLDAPQYRDWVTFA